MSNDVQTKTVLDEAKNQLVSEMLVDGKYTKALVMIKPDLMKLRDDGVPPSEIHKIVERAYGVEIKRHTFYYFWKTHMEGV